LATLASASFLITMTASPPPAAAAAPPLADRVIAQALTHLNAPYVWGSAGPRTFDCSGLVYRVFVDTGLGALIEYSHDGYELYAIFRERGRATRSGGQPGDLVVYGGGAHIGIYLGDDRVISALVQGVRITGVYALTTPFTAFLHTGLGGRAVTFASTRVAVASSKARHTLAAAFLRARPSITSRPLAILPPFTRLTVLKWSPDPLRTQWVDVRTPSGRVGWVAAWLTR
jgi:cell wall-associated NlpC family hydrolase